LPVTDHEGRLIGVVSETDIISLVGQAEHWAGPIKNMIFPNISSYPADTPIQKVIDFLNRTSVRRVMIVQDGILVGYISRTPLLRWLRNQWAMMCGRHDEIIPNSSSSEELTYSLSTAIAELTKELHDLDAVITTSGDQEFVIQNRTRIVSLISRCQETMDHVLKYGSIPTTWDSVILLPEQKKN